MRLALICASAALAAASLGAAAEPAAAPATATATKDAKAKKPRKVCRRDTSTGSTIPKKVCRIVEEPADPAKDASAARAPLADTRDATVAQ